MNRKQIVWQVVGALHNKTQRWHHPPKAEASRCDTYILTKLGNVKNPRMYEVVAERAIKTRKGVVGLRITTHLLIPEDWVDILFGQNDIVKIPKN